MDWRLLLWGLALVSVVRGQSSVDTNCNATFKWSLGIISSPNYPGNYSNNLNCVYTIDSREWETVGFMFRHFDLENNPTCSYDRLTVLRDSGYGWHHIAEYCGSYLPRTFFIQGRVQLIFKTDGTVVRSGFQLNYKIYKGISPPIFPAYSTPAPDCNATFSSAYGIISSPNYPGNYSNNLNCVYTIKSREWETVVLKFREFDIENNPTCGYDRLTVLRDSGYGWQETVEYCGSNLPRTISIRGRVQLVFKTDGSVVGSGFQLQYTIYIG